MGSRRIATVTALSTFPLFFHSQAVRVRATVTEENGVLRLEQGGARVWLAAAQGGRLPDAKTAAEVTGTFLDVGRLDANDLRSSVDLGALSQKLLNRPWPSTGELLVLLVDGSVEAPPLAAPSVRNVALDPDRYLDQEVTLVGRFRGRNLYGDLPDAPGRSRWDFVLQSADAAIWVTGRRPRGDGFDLNIDNRVDTGRWLEVSGVVKADRGLVRIEATALRAAQAPAQTALPEALVRVPVAVPPPEVVFSAPTDGETDVEPAAHIRVQFSRDLKADSVKGQVAVAYVGVPQPPPQFTTTYDRGRRMLEIRFAAPLEPFRTVQVTLGNGITATDGQPLNPWKLTFSVGS
jgi:Bacterial Ig-like domain